MSTQNTTAAFIHELAIETIKQHKTLPAPFQTEKEHVNSTMVKVRSHLITMNNDVILDLQYLNEKATPELKQIIHDVLLSLQSAEGIHEDDTFSNAETAQYLYLIFWYR